MSTRARIATLGGVAAVLEAGLGVAALVAFGPAEIAFYALACAAATVAVTVALWRLLGVPSDGGGEGGGGVGGDGGGADRGGDGGGGDRSGTDGEPDEPTWWPRFERDFREHARERDRTPV